MDKKKIGIIIGIIVIILALIVIFSSSGDECYNYAGQIVDSEISVDKNGDYEGYFKIDFNVEYPNSTSMSQSDVDEFNEILEYEKEVAKDNESLSIMNDLALIFACHNSDEGEIDESLDFKDIDELTLEDNILTGKFHGHLSVENENFEMMHFYMAIPKYSDSEDYDYYEYSLYGFDKNTSMEYATNYINEE